MEIKTYTKKDIATELSKRQNKSVRSSITIVDDLFRILKDYLTDELNDIFQNAEPIPLKPWDPMGALAK